MEHAMSSTRAFAIRDAVALCATILLSAAVAVSLGVGARRSQGPKVSQLNLGALTKAATMYTNDFDVFPPSYVYGSDPLTLQWSILAQQGTSNPANGYIHWSSMFSARGYAPTRSMFIDPDAPSGGAPNANPGSTAQFWEPGQLNDLGLTAPAAVPNDRQAKRLAYTANRAIMPRNKLAAGSAPRHDRLVAATEIIAPSSTILFTELLSLAGAQPWRGLQDPSAGVYKSHRPVTPFLGLSVGADVYNEPNSPTFTRFRYATSKEVLPVNQLGPGMILEGTSPTTLNAVARSPIDGAANFAFIDGSVRRFTIQQTLQQRLWGSRFYSITGNSSVQP
jgi:prepilin-type processing-associated H-X9-DG protein